MAAINPHLLARTTTYIFPLIQETLQKLLKEQPGIDVINLGIGDISLPLVTEIKEGLAAGAEEMTKRPIGYGPAEGLKELREAILEKEYPSFGFSNKELFISCGINEDLNLLQELFSPASSVIIPSPNYPLYQELSTLSGRATTLLPLEERTAFIPHPPKERHDLAYLCSPSNPTGVAMTYKDLERWIKWAHEHKAVIFFDAAYRAFITSKEVPKTIYEIDGAKEVAIECSSFSKSAGFTGLRLGFSLLPKELVTQTTPATCPLYALYQVLKDIKTNGISYPVQIAGLSALSGEGAKKASLQVATYLAQAKRVRECLLTLGFTCYGGIDSPYIWWKVPSGSSWDFYSYLLHKHHILTIPGEGFGKSGQGFVRLSLFISPEVCTKLLSRLQTKVKAEHAL